MRKTLGVFLLVLLLTCSANAGIMGNDAPQPPPPPPSITQSKQTVDGSNPDNTESESPNDAGDSLTRTVLDLLAGILALV